MAKLLTKILVALCIVNSFTQIAKAQAVAVGAFVATNLAEGSLSYAGAEIGKTIFVAEDNTGKLSKNDVADTVGSLLDSQTAQLTEIIQKSAEQITNDVTLNYLENNMKTSMSKMEELIKYYDAEASNISRMRDLQRIEDLAIEAKAAFNSFYSNSSTYPELFWMVYARYANFSATLLAIETEKTIVNNLLASEGIDGFKNDRGKRLSNVALSLLDDVDTFWFQHFPGQNVFGGWGDLTGCIRTSGEPWILNVNGKMLPADLKLATTLGYNYGWNEYGDPEFKKLNNSIARRMDLDGLGRHISVLNPRVKRKQEVYVIPNPSYEIEKALRKPGAKETKTVSQSLPEIVCLQTDFAAGMQAYKSIPGYSGCGGHLRPTCIGYDSAPGQKQNPFVMSNPWFKVSIDRNEMRSGDFINPIVPWEDYTVHNYREKTIRNKGILSVGDYKYFTVPDKKYTSEGALRDGDWEVIQFKNSDTDKKIRSVQISTAFDRYDDYIASFLPSDFNNEAYVKNLTRTVLANWNLETRKIKRAEGICKRLTMSCDKLINEMREIRGGKSNKGGFELFQ